MRFSLFRDVTWGIFVLNYRRFGTTHLHGYSIDGYTLEDGNDRLSRNVGKYLPIYDGETSQKG